MDPFIGEIRIFAGNYAPPHWAFCDGSVLPVAGNEALYSLIANTYGGTSPSTFALPDMRGRLPVHQGTGPGLSSQVIGTKNGTEEASIDMSQMPSHSHMMMASTAQAGSADPQGLVLAKVSVPVYSSEDASTIKNMPADMIGESGASQPHSNLPSLCLNYIIALQGIYPTRN